jgi:hypothetical protein
MSKTAGEAHPLIATSDGRAGPRPLIAMLIALSLDEDRRGSANV